MNNLTYSTVIDQRSCDYTIFLKKPNFVDLLYGEDLSGGNAWAALRAANEMVGKFAKSQILVGGTGIEPVALDTSNPRSTN